MKFEESNDKTQLIFGSLSILQAKDAVSLPVSPPPAARQCHQWQCLSQFVHLLQPDSVTTDIASVSLSTTCSQTVSPLTLPQSVCPPPVARQCHQWHCLSQFVHLLQPDSVTTGIASVSLSTTCSQTVSPLALPQSVCPPPAARQCQH